MKKEAADSQNQIFIEQDNRNVLTEQHSEVGFMDYLLLDRNGRREMIEFVVEYN